MELYQDSKNFLEKLDNQESVEKFRASKFSTESSAICEKFSIKMSTDEIKPVVTEKHQFECRRESKFILFRQESDARMETRFFMGMVCR